MTSFTVSNAAELQTALAAAQGGDEILLASGNYGEFFVRGLDFASDVTIRSADADAPASFGSIGLDRVNNLVFDGIFVDFQPDEQTVAWDSAIKIDNSHGISILNSRIEGGPAVNGVPVTTAPGGLNSTGNVIGLPAGKAITANFSTDLLIEGNDISQFHKGVGFGSVDGAVVRDNEIHHLRTTPLEGGDVDNLLVDSNHFHSFIPWQLGGAGDHGDLIHFWTVPSAQSGPSRNYDIINNFLEQGDGVDALFGVYLDDNNFGLGYTDVVIKNNVILNGDASGIIFENVRNAEVAYNTLLNPDPDLKAPNIRIDSLSQANIHHNIAAGPPSDTLVGDNGNVYVQRTDPYAANYYGHLFVDSLSPHAGLAEIQIRPGSALANLGAGAAVSRFDASPDRLTALISNRADSEDDSIVSFDGRLTADAGGFVTAGNTSFSWDFGDGTTASGLAVEHRYATHGSYDVVLRVERAGVIDETRTTIIVADPMLLDLDLYTNGARDVSGYLSSVVGGRVQGEQQSNNILSAFHLNTSGGFSLERHDVPQIFSLEEFTLSFSFKRDSSTAEVGHVMRVHGSWYVTLEQNGELTFRYDDVANQAFRLTTTGANLTDARWHSIDLTFDTDTGLAIFYVDGRNVGQGDIGGRTQAMENWGFSLGNPFGPGAGAMIGSVQLLDEALAAGQIGATAANNAPSLAKAPVAAVPAELADKPVDQPVDDAGDQSPAVVGKVEVVEDQPLIGGALSSAVVGKVAVVEAQDSAGQPDRGAADYWLDASANEAYAGLDLHGFLVGLLRSAHAKAPVSLDSVIADRNADIGIDLPPARESIGDSIAHAFGGAVEAGQSGAIFAKAAIDPSPMMTFSIESPADLRWGEAHPV